MLVRPILRRMRLKTSATSLGIRRMKKGNLNTSKEKHSPKRNRFEECSESNRKRQSAYLTEHPYGRLVETLTSLPDIACPKACSA